MKHSHSPPIPMSMDVKRIILKIRIMGLIKKQRIYPYAIIKAFDKMGFSSFFGPTLKNDTYNALKMLEKAGYIKMNAKVEGGKAKTYYFITPQGSAMLAQMGKIMKATFKEVSKLFK